MKALIAVFAVLALAGCGREQEGVVPEACTSPPAELASALGAAPGPVRVDGVPLSHCLVRNASVGDVQAVGSTFLAAAQTLDRERDAVALGYLVGALRRGGQASQGIYSEMVRRVESEAGPFRRSPGFERGLRAGRSSG